MSLIQVRCVFPPLSFFLPTFPSLTPSFLQAGSRSDGPSRPESEAGRGGAQQKPADIPSASWSPSQDVICCWHERHWQGEGFVAAQLAFWSLQVCASLPTFCVAGISDLRF